MNLADEYHLPLHELFERWTSRELSQLMIWRKMQQDREVEALDKTPKEQEPEEIIQALEALV